MKITEIDDNGINLIKSFESFRAKPYLCQAGVPTIGYGTTRYPNNMKVSLSDPPIDEKKANEYLLHDVEYFELKVDAYCTDLLTQNQFNALVSFTYNVGDGALKTSTLLKKVNANPNNAAIRDEFMKWCYAGKTKSIGLERRRKAEADMYFS